MRRSLSLTPLLLFLAPALFADEPAPSLVLTGHQEDCFAVGFTPDGKRIVSVCRDRSARVWDADSGKELKSFTAAADPLYGMSISPDGKRFVASGDKALYVWLLDGDDKPTVLKGHTGNYIGSVAWSRDGSRLASVGEDMTVRLWDAVAGKEMLTLRGHEKVIYSVVFSTDGRRLLSAGQDGTARVWDAITGEQIAVLRAHVGAVYGVAFTPDGGLIATAGIDDKTIKLWDGRTYEEVTTLHGHSQGVRGLVFSPDGKILASAGEDHVVKLWNMGHVGRWWTTPVFATFQGHTKMAVRVAFSADGKRLVSSSWDHTVRVWTVPPLKP
jgi:WD40 repeat protein